MQLPVFFFWNPSINEFLWGAFHSTQNFEIFGWYIKWNGPFWFGLTETFGTRFEGGPLSTDWTFRSVGPKCPFPFDKIVVPSTAPLYPGYKNNNQTRGGLGRVYATGRYRSKRLANFRNFKSEFLLNGKRPWVFGLHFRQKSSLARANHVRWTVEFGGKRLRIKRLGQQRDRCWPLVGHKIIVLCQITDKPSNKSWNWFVKSSIPEALSPVLENFCRRFSWLNWPTLGLRGCFYQSNKNNLYKCPRTYFS